MQVKKYPFKKVYISQKQVPQNTLYFSPKYTLYACVCDWPQKNSIHMFFCVRKWLITKVDSPPWVEIKADIHLEQVFRVDMIWINDMQHNIQQLYLCSASIWDSISLNAQNKLQ